MVRRGGPGGRELTHSHGRRLVMGQIVATSSFRRRSRILLASMLGLAAIPAGAALHSPAASAAISGRPLTAYVANMDDDTVTPINLTTNTAGAPIAVGDGPSA